METAKKRIVERKKRAFRIRKKIEGTADRPRLCVRRTLKHMYAQIVDDISQTTIAQVGSTSKEVAAILAAAEKKSKVDVSAVIGGIIADKAKDKGVTTVVFDRKGYAYHGRVKALAEAARAKGLVF